MENTVFDCPNCKLPIDLSLIVGEKAIVPNPDVCHICHRPTSKKAIRNRKKKLNPSSSNQRRPEITKQMLEAAKPKKEKIYSGETKCCKVCLKCVPMEEFYLVLKRTGKQAGQSYRLNRCNGCITEYMKLNYQKTRARISEKSKNLPPEEKEARRIKSKERAERFKQNNPEYYKLANAARAQKAERRIKRRIRNRLADVLKGEKGVSFSKSVGCSSKELRAHIESKFLLGMTWENYGYGSDKWVIDHIKPIDLFDKTDSKKLVAANHFSNLQPLWMPLNDAKSSNYDPDHPMGWKGLDALLSDEDKVILGERLNYKF